MSQRKKRFFKISALAGCILLGVGLLMIGAGYVVMGMNLNAFTHPRGGAVAPITVGYPVDTVDAIEVHASMGSVTIQGSSSKDAQEVEVRAACDSVYEVYVQNGILMVESLDTGTSDWQGGWNWFQMFHFYPEGDWDVVITVPEKLLSSLYVEAGCGDITLMGLKAEKVTLDCSLGNVKLEEVSASKELTVAQSMGDVELEDCTGKELTLENEMGAVTAAGCGFGKSSVTSSSGDVTLTDSTFESLTAETDLGSCILKEVAVDGLVECTADMGDVELKRLKSLDISLTAEAGNITGTIQGVQEDYRITVETELGVCNLTNQITGGRGELMAVTEMGDIDLKFTG